MTTTAPKSPATALEYTIQHNVPSKPGTGLQRLIWSVKRTFLCWRLRREGQALMASFLRVAGEMGFHPNCQLHPPSQMEKLLKVNAIAKQLRWLKYPHLKNLSTNPE